MLGFSGGHLIWLSAWGATATTIYTASGLSWLGIPWLPLSLIGIAVAFYVGFKNNAAYERLWEARKIWGAIVNDSRSFAVKTKHFVTDHFSEKDVTSDELYAVHKRIIYRHIAWLYRLRFQMLIPTPWEHVSASKHIKRINEQRKEKWGVGVLNEKPHQEVLDDFLSDEEVKHTLSVKNGATQLLEIQSAELKALRDQDLIDDFRHMELQNKIDDFYTHQGKSERIKNYPLPRQYASMSFYFVALFIFLLPFGLMPEFEKLGEGIIWLTVPFTVVIGWVFLMMELVGDYSENPFEGLGNDIPMMSLCRTIEIDLREMLGETELPPKIEAVNSVMM